ncbi:hypothetical protein CI109_102254 [Kwoniella shandongensis]|uniref:Uncharacterized protein n=1 Tax=Kwoniella shandongensis TaxID=1734106 RepID=A0A5M6C430_9TREE|nr:uncharacterized protein CI109_003592 [Kwoniella shandongensis]KAA5527939.1 hypothetical protein CI109_003592 [Kwoniella shandongensis]
MSTLLWISDASPLFFYSPAPAYFAGQNLASWTSNDGSSSGGAGETGAPGAGAGNSTTYHTTSGSAAVVIPSIYAKSFVPIFSSPSGYNTTLQVNSEPALPWLSGQNWTSPPQDFNAQTFQLDLICETQDGCGEVTFQGAWVGTELAPAGSEMDSVTLDDSSPLIQYSGFAPVGTNNEVVQVTIADYNSTLSMTSTNGATAQVNFTGASIFITGVTSPSCSTYTITLDNSQTATFDANNSITAHDTLLYFATNLDTTTSHSIQVESGGGMVIDSFTVNGPKGAVGFGDTLGPSTSPSVNGTQPSNGTPVSNNASPNAGVIVGAVLGTLVGIAILWYLIRRCSNSARKEDGEEKLNPWDEANLLQNMKNEEVHVTTAANQRYVYPGLIAHSDLKKK